MAHIPWPLKANQIRGIALSNEPVFNILIITWTSKYPTRLQLIFIIQENSKTF